MKIELKKHLADILQIEQSRIELKEEEILEILKRRLTKKERKFLLCELEGLNIEETKERLELDKKRAKEIKDSLYTKIKHPKIRNELVC